MKNTEHCKWSTCIVSHRMELFGIALILIATFLTIGTLNGLGIVALFATGVVLCLFKQFCGFINPLMKTSCPCCSNGACSENCGYSIEKAEQAMENEGGNPDKSL